MKPHIFHNSELFDQDYASCGGHAVKYRRLSNGTCYHAETPADIVSVLEDARVKHTVIRVFLGDTTTGKSWNDEFGAIGKVGRSTGTVKIPLTVSEGDRGGQGILDHCIVRIQSRTRILYEHTDFHAGIMEVKKGPIKKLPWEVMLDGSVQARFGLKQMAEKYILFLLGVRFFPIHDPA